MVKAFNTRPSNFAPQAPKGAVDLGFAASLKRCPDTKPELFRSLPGDFPAQWKKGAGVDPHPFLLLFLLYQFVGGKPPKFRTLFSYPIHGVSGKIGKID